VQFDDVELFILNNSDIGSAIQPKLLETLADTQKRKVLKIELAAVIDLGEHFIKATYQLEGDGLLVPPGYCDTKCCCSHCTLP